MNTPPQTPPPPPSYTLVQELEALEEVLNIARGDLRTLLTCDHPPPEADILIDRERAVIADLEWLVYDARSKIVMRALAAMVI